MKFGIKSKGLDTYETLVRFEIAAQQLSFMKAVGEEKIDWKQAWSRVDEGFLNQFHGLAFEFCDLAKKASNNLTPDQYKEMIELAKEK